MTEDEAKGKWCPFVRFHIEGKAPTFTVAPNREQRGTKCIGSACMAWRWNPRRDPEAADRSCVAPSGYCGLAGKPE